MVEVYIYILSGVTFIKSYIKCNCLFYIYIYNVFNIKELYWQNEIEYEFFLQHEEYHHMEKSYEFYGS